MDLKLSSDLTYSPWSNVFLNNKIEWIIFAIIIGIELVALNVLKLQISLFVGILAMTTSIFVSYLAIKTTYDLAYLGEQRKILHHFINELMKILNYNKTENPMSITDISPDTKKPQTNIDTTSLGYILKMEIAFDVIVRTKLFKYLINLVNTPGEFLYLPKELQKSIITYTSKYKIVHDIQTEILNVLNKDDESNFSIGDWKNMGKLGFKAITLKPYKLPDKVNENFLIVHSYDEDLFEVFNLNANKDLINELNYLAMEIYIKSSKSLSKMH